MRTLFKRKRAPGKNDFLQQYSNILLASLVTVLLIGCGARVAEEKAERESLEVPQAAVRTLLEPEADVGLTPPDNPAPRQRETQRTTDADPALSTAVVTGSSATPPRNESRPRAVMDIAASEAAASGGEANRLAAPPAHPADASDHTSQSRFQNHPQWHTGPESNRENYLEVEENTVKLVATDPVSTFSIDVDTAAYSNIRRMIMGEGRLPPRDAVRLEEMINYFHYDYPRPDLATRPLAIHTELAEAPWNHANRLLMVGVQGYTPDPETRPAANLVFLVDVSGSMHSPDKLGLVQRSLKLLVDQMRPEDRIALVVYAGAAGMVLDSTTGSRKNEIKHAIDSLRAGGSTNGAAGIQLAYRIAEQNHVDGGINRVIIASDGDLNVGITGIDALKEMISIKREKGIALTTLGFGSGNYNYSLMEQIADVGNGNAAYIDSLNEARKVLVDELQSTLLTIAKDVKIQIEFNPQVVKEYRLIGYENRLLNREDFINDKVDAGEIGAGHTVTALYEITLVDSDGGLIPSSRYQTATAVTDSPLNGELAYIRLRHKPADGNTSTENGRPVLLTDMRSVEQTSSDFRFAAAVAGFGQLLRGGKYTADLDYDQVLEMARGARGDDANGYRIELVKLIEMAKLL